MFSVADEKFCVRSGTTWDRGVEWATERDLDPSRLVVHLRAIHHQGQRVVREEYEVDGHWCSVFLAEVG